MSSLTLLTHSVQCNLWAHTSFDLKCTPFEEEGLSREVCTAITPIMCYNYFPLRDKNPISFTIYQCYHEQLRICTSKIVNFD